MFDPSGISVRQGTKQRYTLSKKVFATVMEAEEVFFIEGKVPHVLLFKYDIVIASNPRTLQSLLNEICDHLRSLA